MDTASVAVWISVFSLLGAGGSIYLANKALKNGSSAHAASHVSRTINDLFRLNWSVDKATKRILTRPFANFSDKKKAVESLDKLTEEEDRIFYTLRLSIGPKPFNNGHEMKVVRDRVLVSTSNFRDDQNLKVKDVQRLANEYDSARFDYESWLILTNTDMMNERNTLLT